MSDGDERRKGDRTVFLMRPIGYARSPYKDTGAIPKGLGAKHVAEGSLEIREEFETGLTDIEGFSHLIVIWAFDPSQGFGLVGTPPSDDRPHGAFATRSPLRPSAIGLTVVELLGRKGPVLRVCGIDMLDGIPIPRYQAISLKRSAGTATTRVAGRRRIAYRTHSTGALNRSR